MLLGRKININDPNSLSNCHPTHIQNHMVKCCQKMTVSKIIMYLNPNNLTLSLSEFKDPI